MVAAGNPDVIKEAKGEVDYNTKKKRGGKVEGKKAMHRMDRPKRASGGKVGSDRNPFSSAHKMASANDKSGGKPN